MAVASLVLGIIALVFGFLIEAWFGIICGILSIILGAVASNTNPSRQSMSNAGVICGIISVIICGIYACYYYRNIY